MASKHRSDRTEVQLGKPVSTSYSLLIPILNERRGSYSAPINGWNERFDVKIIDDYRSTKSPFSLRAVGSSAMDFQAESYGGFAQKIGISDPSLASINASPYRAHPLGLASSHRGGRAGPEGRAR